MDDFKWGIIGPGNIANEFANDLQFAKSKQRVSAVLSRSMENAEEFAKEHNASFFTDNISRFLTNAEIDAVYIATPHAQHHKFVIACLQQRIPVLCEKPMGINNEQAKEMIFTAKSTKTFLMEGMWIRFLPSIQQLLSELHKIGNITSIKADLSFRAPRDSKHKRFFDPALGGGSLLDLGVYPVFLSFLLMGKPCSIKVNGRLSMEGVDEACSMLFKYAGSQYAMLESSLIDETEANALVFGEKGFFKIFKPWNEKPEKMILHLYDGDDNSIPCMWEGKGMHYEADEVVNCVRSGKMESKILPLQSTMDVMEIMDDIRRQMHVTYKADQLVNQ